MPVPIAAVAASFPWTPALAGGAAVMKAMGYNNVLPHHTREKLAQLALPAFAGGSVVPCEIEREDEVRTMLRRAIVNDSRYRWVAGLENAARHEQTIRFFVNWCMRVCRVYGHIIVFEDHDGEIRGAALLLPPGEVTLENQFYKDTALSGLTGLKRVFKDVSSWGDAPAKRLDMLGNVSRRMQGEVLPSDVHTQRYWKLYMFGVPGLEEVTSDDESDTEDDEYDGGLFVAQEPELEPETAAAGAAQQVGKAVAGTAATASASASASASVSASASASTPPPSTQGETEENGSGSFSTLPKASAIEVAEALLMTVKRLGMADAVPVYCETVASGVSNPLLERLGWRIVGMTVLFKKEDDLVGMVYYPPPPPELPLSRSKSAEDFDELFGDSDEECEYGAADPDTALARGGSLQGFDNMNAAADAGGASTGSPFGLMRAKSASEYLLCCGGPRAGPNGSARAHARARRARAHAVARQRHRDMTLSEYADGDVSPGGTSAAVAAATPLTAASSDSDEGMSALSPPLTTPPVAAAGTSVYNDTDDDGWGDASFVRTPQVRGGNGGHDLDGDNDDDDEERDAAEEAE